MKGALRESLLEAERERPGFSREQRAAMWSAIQASAVRADVASDASVPGREGRNSFGDRRAPVDASARSSLGLLRSLKFSAWLAAAACVGVVLGATAHARFGEPRVVVVVPPSASSIAPSPPSTVPLQPSVNSAPNNAVLAPASASVTTVSVWSLAAAPRVGAAPGVASVSASATPSDSRVAATSGSVSVGAKPLPVSGSAPKDPPRDGALGRERVLLDVGRTALSRGDASSALAAFEAHAREFPSSQLAEEREAFSIQALASANRRTDAKQRALTFRKSHPNSALLPMVKAATE